MPAPTTLAEYWAERMDENALKPKVRHEIQGRRDFMAGAHAALLLQARGVTPIQLHDEVFGFARTIGTAAETAT